MVSIQDLQKDLNNLSIPSDSGYMYSYPHFLNQFSDKQNISVEDIVIGAYLSYGWMPKILQFNTQIVDDIVSKLNKLKSVSFPFEGPKEELKPLHKIQDTVNGSVVGMSKLLHFLNPECFPIFDSRVYQYLYNEEPYSYRLNTLEKYTEYVSIVNSIVQEESFEKLILEPINQQIKTNFGYSVTGTRAVELIMYSTQVNKN